MRWVAIIFYLIILLAVSGALGELRWPGGGLTVCLLIAVLSFVSILVHELGHAIAAMRIGADVVALVALPFELRFRPMRLGLAPRRKHRDLGGYVLFVPPPGVTWRQAILVSAAGPLANFAFVPIVLLLGAAATACFSAAGSHWTTRPNGGLLPSDAELAASIHLASYLRAADASRLLADALAILSAGMGVANLIPFGGSDGASILRRWKSRSTA
jgi:Zn-dependent protease